MVNRVDQNEIYCFWHRLSEGGEEVPCGLLKNKFGLSWQVVPVDMNDMLNFKDSKKANKSLTEMYGMKKTNIDTLRQILSLEKNC